MILYIRQPTTNMQNSQHSRSFYQESNQFGQRQPTTNMQNSQHSRSFYQESNQFRQRRSPPQWTFNMCNQERLEKNSFITHATDPNIQLVQETLILPNQSSHITNPNVQPIQETLIWPNQSSGAIDHNIQPVQQILIWPIKPWCEWDPDLRKNFPNQNTKPFPPPPIIGPDVKKIYPPVIGPNVKKSNPSQISQTVSITLTSRDFFTDAYNSDTASYHSDVIYDHSETESDRSVQQHYPIDDFNQEQQKDYQQNCTYSQNQHQYLTNHSSFDSKINSSPLNLPFSQNTKIVKSIRYTLNLPLSQNTKNVKSIRYTHNPYNFAEPTKIVHIVNKDSQSDDTTLIQHQFTPG